jgi:hypothetical protein
MPTSGGETFGDMVWLPDGWLYYVVEGDSAKGPELWRTAEDKRPEQVPSSSYGCESTAHISSLFSVNGDLGMAVSCATEEESRLLAVDPGATRAPRVLLSSPVPLENVEWSELDSDRYADASSRHCRVMVSLDRSRVTEILVEDRVDGVTLSGGRTIDDHGDVTEETCQGRENVGWPATSATGSLVFASSAGAGDLSGVFRRNVQFSLYLRAPRDSGARLLADGFSDVLDTAISDNGEFVVVTTGQAGRGIRLVDLGTNSVTTIRSGYYFKMALSPDGERLAVVHYPGPPEAAQEVHLIDISEHR